MASENPRCPRTTGQVPNTSQPIQGTKERRCKRSAGRSLEGKGSVMATSNFKPSARANLFENRPLDVLCHPQELYFFPCLSFPSLAFKALFLFWPFFSLSKFPSKISFSFLYFFPPSLSGSPSSRFALTQPSTSGIGK